MEECYETVLKQLQQALEEREPEQVSIALQALTETLYERHAEEEAPDYHRDSVSFNDYSRHGEFLSALQDALRRLSRQNRQEHWFVVARSEIHGFRTVVLDQSNEELGFAVSE